MSNWALTSALVVAVFSAVSCAKAPDDNRVPEARAVGDEEVSRAKPPVNPSRWNLDQDGWLREDEREQVFGFVIPKGGFLRLREPERVVVAIETTMERLVQFYSSRMYTVIRGEGGHIVRHNRRTAARTDDADAVDGARLYLSHSRGRVQELRFLSGQPVGDGPTNALEEQRRRVERGEVDRHDHSAQTRAILERIERWQRANPGRPLYD